MVFQRDFLAANERYKDLLREAKRERLVRQARAGQAGVFRSSRLHGLLSRVGDSLATLRCKLQAACEPASAQCVQPRPDFGDARAW